MHRREFLKWTGAAALGSLSQYGCVAGLIQAKRDTGLSLGYVCGEVTDAGALVWLRAAPNSRVALHYGEDPLLGEFSATEPVAVDAEADSTAILPLDGLAPKTRYYYRAAVAGKMPGPIATFVTAPHPDDDAAVSFCFSGDTRDSYRPFMALNAVHAQRPDFFLYLGDTIYADINGVAHQLPEFWAKYRRNRNDLAAEGCFGATSVYAIWDDHEVANDFAPGHPLAPIGRKAFLDYWPVRQNGGAEGAIYRSYRWGRAAELFILDVRQHRDPAQATMLGAAQKRWLLDRLARSAATFKFIATPVPMAGGGTDRWDGYPKERQEIFSFIRDRRVGGVVFLSADLHYAAITKLPNSGGLRDITAGPIAAPLNRVTNGTASRFEFFLAENFNFAKITIDPKTDPYKAVVEFIDQDNTRFHTATLRAG